MVAGPSSDGVAVVTYAWNSRNCPPMFTLMIGLVDPLRMGFPFLSGRVEAIDRAGRGQSKTAITQLPVPGASEPRSRPIAPPRGVEAKSLDRDEASRRINWRDGRR